MYIGNDYHAFEGAMTYMVPQRPLIFTHIISTNLLREDWFDHVTKHPMATNVALIYVDVCAPEVSYSHTYMVFLLKTLAIILACQAKNGSVVIKTNMLLFKPVLDVLYVLSGKYAYMHIVRPFVSEDMDSRFVIFTGLLSSSSSAVVENLISSANTASSVAPNEIISSVTDCKMSHYFTNKIEECNLLIGQKYVEKHDSLVTLIKAYTNDNRVESAKNAAIARCIYWCEKNSIPLQSSAR
jgi:hypothetical protein